jgi:hypothetical protein
MRHKLGTGPSKARNPLPSCCTMRDSPPPQLSLGSPWLFQQIVPNGQFLNKRIPITDPVHGLQFGAEEACTRGPASSHNPL